MADVGFIFIGVSILAALAAAVSLWLTFFCFAHGGLAAGAGKGYGFVAILCSGLALVLCINLWWQVILSDGRNEFEAELSVAREYLEQKRYDECLTALSDAKNAYGRHYKRSREANETEGMCYYGMGDYRAALDALKRADSIGYHEMNYIRMAVSYAKCGDTENAQRLLDNFQGDAYGKAYIAGEISLAKNELSEADSQFASVLEKTGDKEIKRDAYIGRATVAKQMRSKNAKKYLDAEISILEEAIRELNADDDVTINEMLGEAYYAKGEYDLAVARYERLLEQGYKKPHVFRNAAIIYQRQGKLSKAEKVLLEMKKMYPENYQCYMQLALLYIEAEERKPSSTRDYSAAIENYEKAVEYANGETCEDMKRLEEKIKKIRK